MISLIREEVVGNMKWISDEEMLDLIVIAESTPGVLAVNTATFVGYKTSGIAGAAAATVGVTLPSLIIVGAISLFFEQFKNLKYVSYAFSGIRAGVVLLIADAVLKLDKKNTKNLFYFLILICAVISSLVLKISAVYIILAAAASGIIYSVIFNKTGRDKK